MTFTPTKQQTAFIDDASLELALVACPGSGKTHTAALRFTERCKARKDYGIALLSFTNTAIDEAFGVARENGAAGLIGYPNSIETIDAFFQHYIFEPFIRVRVPEAILPVQIIEEDRTYPALNSDKACKVRGISPNLPGRSYGQPISAWDTRAYIDLEGKWIWQYDAGRPNSWTTIEGSTAQLEIIGVGKARCFELGYATFNDILLFCYALLSNHKRRIAEIVAHRFREIIVDEAQDTSMLHQAMLKLLAAAGSRISYVGDPHQAIYAFNHANAKYLGEIAGTSHVKHELTENYRSIEPIVDVVNKRFGTRMIHKRAKAHKLHGAYVFIGTDEAASVAFEGLLKRTNLHVSRAAIVARKWAHFGLSLRTSVTDGWHTAYKHALRAWQSEQLHDVETALRSAVALMRLAISENTVAAMEGNRLKQIGWLFVRSGALPSPRDDETPLKWAERLSPALVAFLEAIDIEKHKAFGNRLSTQRISDKGSALKKLSVTRPTVRTTVVHRVKGESISAVLIVAPEEQHASWFKTPTSLEEFEEYNVCYVAFTRAADLLVLHCPTEAIADQWRKHGFDHLPAI